ncbi:hypothetical protein HK102_008051, partial [Quaeritorhiza haematococci]
PRKAALLLAAGSLLILSQSSSSPALYAQAHPQDLQQHSLSNPNTESSYFSPSFVDHSLLKRQDSNANVNQVNNNAPNASSNTTYGANSSSASASSHSPTHAEEWPPLFPIDVKTTLPATVLLVLANIVSVAGGIGGGGFFVPILMMVQHLGAHQAVPLSKAMIFAANVIITFGNLKYIDFAAAALLEPPILAGTVLGVYVNILSPSWLILILLFLVLSITTWRAYAKGRVIYSLENQAKEREHGFEAVAGGSASSSAASSSLNVPLEDRSVTQVDAAKAKKADGSDTPSSSTDSLDKDTGHQDLSGSTDELLTTKVWQCRFFGISRKTARLVCFLMPLLLTLLALMLTTVGRDRVPACSPAYWVLSMIPLLLAAGTTVLVGMQLRKEYRLKHGGDSKAELDGLQPVEDARGEWVWNFKTTVGFPLISFISGIIAGALGVGGGILVGPLLLEMSKNPDALKTSALSSLLVLFTATASTFQYFLLGRLDMSYVGWFSAFTILTGAAAQVVVHRAIKRTGRKSFIVFFLALGLGIAAVLTLY